MQLNRRTQGLCSISFIAHLHSFHSNSTVVYDPIYSTNSHLSPPICDFLSSSFFKRSVTSLWIQPKCLVLGEQCMDSIGESRFHSFLKYSLPPRSSWKGVKLSDLGIGIRVVRSMSPDTVGVATPRVWPCDTPSQIPPHILAWICCP